MPKSLTSLNPSLLAFKPRQVLLANLEMKQSMPNNSDNRAAQTLSPHQKGPLLHAVARFLEGNGFSKTLKKFRSEAQIEVGNFFCYKFVAFHLESFLIY